MNFDAVTSFISRLRNYAAIVKMLLEVDLPKLEAAAVTIKSLLGDITASHATLASVVATPAAAETSAAA